MECLFNIFIMFCLLLLAFVNLISGHILSHKILQIDNDLNTTWEVLDNFNRSAVRKMGVIMEPKIDELNIINPLRLFSTKIPKYFDSRESWPHCESIKEIRDQGCCGSCWAVSGASVITDRICIFSGGERTFYFSGEDILTCCSSTVDNCGDCNGTKRLEAIWLYYIEHGISSETHYGRAGCKSYSLPGKCPDGINNLSAPSCLKNCYSVYSNSYEEDLHFGEKYYGVRGEENIMLEIMNNGPVQVTIHPYYDFFTYKGGIYKNNGSPLFPEFHSVKILGWGEDQGVAYWTIANSWGTAWGENGFFRIRRGVNECGVENLAFAPIPKF